MTKHYILAYLNDFWRFNPSATSWSQLSIVNGPTVRSSHRLIVNRVSQVVYVLFGNIGKYSNLNTAYSYSISSGQWTTIPTTGQSNRGGFGATIDDKNMIYYSGGFDNSSELQDLNFENSLTVTLISLYLIINLVIMADLRYMTCQPGEFNNAGTCTPCPVGTWSSSYNAASCTVCTANTYSTTIGATASSACLSCSAGSTSSAGASSCDTVFSQLSVDSATTNDVPSRRYGHSLQYDNKGGFWVFGGDNTGGWLSSLYRYNLSTGSFSYIDGANNTNGYMSGKPSSRRLYVSWADAAGNLWLFGGHAWNDAAALSSNGLVSDTWVYNASSPDANKWRYVTGSKVPNERVAGQVEPRLFAASWTDAVDGCFYLFGGSGVTTTNAAWGKSKSGLVIY